MKTFDYHTNILGKALDRAIKLFGEHRLVKAMFSHWRKGY